MSINLLQMNIGLIGWRHEPMRIGADKCAICRKALHESNFRRWIFC